MTVSEEGSGSPYDAGVKAKGERVDRTPFNLRLLISDEGIQDIQMTTLGHGDSWHAVAMTVDRIRDLLAAGPRCTYAILAQLPDEESGQCCLLASHNKGAFGGGHILATGYPFGSAAPGVYVMGEPA